MQTSPFEGGVHVPAFAVDFSPDKRYLGDPNREYDGLFHVSDWLPTLAAYAGIAASELPDHLDGIDQSKAFRNNLISPRTEMIYDLIDTEDSFFSEGMISFRMGDIKIIDGMVRDKHWYTEPSKNRLNTTDETWVSFAGEIALKLGEFFFEDSKFDTAHHILAHGLVMHSFSSYDEILLYNISADPLEKNNIRESHPEILKIMMKRVQELIAHHVPQQPIWLILNQEASEASWVPGDCSMNPLIPEDECLFLHTWAADDEDPLSFVSKFSSARDQVNSLAKTVVKMCIVALLWTLLMSSISLFLLYRLCRRFYNRICDRRKRFRQKND